MGWLTVAAYAAAAVMCFVAARRRLMPADSEKNRRRRRLWLGVAVFMLLLCINKQFDLQSLVTDVGRVLADRGGWYDSRRIVQRWFVLGVAAVGVMTFVILVWKIRSVLRESVWLLLGLTSLITFIVIRAASFHHVDVLLRQEILGLRLNWILELGGIALISLGAARPIRRPRPG